MQQPLLACNCTLILLWLWLLLCLASACGRVMRLSVSLSHSLPWFVVLWHGLFCQLLFFCFFSCYTVLIPFRIESSVRLSEKIFKWKTNSMRSKYFALLFLVFRQKSKKSIYIFFGLILVVLLKLASEIQMFAFKFRKWTYWKHFC